MSRWLTGKDEKATNNFQAFTVQLKTLTSTTGEFTLSDGVSRVYFQGVTFVKYYSPLLAAVLLFCSWSLWGCTQQKNGSVHAKIQELEARYEKLEEEHRALQMDVEQSHKKLAQVESQRSLLEKQKLELAAQVEKQKIELTRQLQTAVREGEELRKQLVQRTTERDSAQTNLMQFGKELQALVGRVETAMNNMPANSNVTIVPASRRAD
jgi:predicted component of viral defense system (DUF524 family)